MPGYGRTFDEAVEDGYQNGRKARTSSPDWYIIAATFVRLENPIREYKVMITPGG